MSASICWERISEIRRTVDVGAPSSFQEAMARAGLELPVELRQTDIPVLRGMAAAHGGGSCKDNPYLRLIVLIEKNEAIRIWAEY